MKNKAEMKNKAAQELNRIRWAKTTKAERSETLKHVSKAGWLPEHREKRLANAGRPVSPDRCPCGIMTKDRAAKRNHKCSATG